MIAPSDDRRWRPKEYVSHQRRRKEKAVCPDCEVKTTFVEVEYEQSINVFFVVKLVESKERVFQCTSCGVVCDLDDEGAGDEESRAEQQRAAKEERRQRDEAEARRLECDAKRRERQADDELATLRARMGIETPTAASSASTQQESRRSWWRPWRR